MYTILCPGTYYIVLRDDALIDAMAYRLELALIGYEVKWPCTVW